MQECVNVLALVLSVPDDEVESALCPPLLQTYGRVQRIHVQMNFPDMLLIQGVLVSMLPVCIHIRSAFMNLGFVSVI